jgi:hypothetical protein
MACSSITATSLWKILFWRPNPNFYLLYPCSPTCSNPACIYNNLLLALREMWRQPQRVHQYTNSDTGRKGPSSYRAEHITLYINATTSPSNFPLEEDCFRGCYCMCFDRSNIPEDKTLYNHLLYGLTFYNCPYTNILSQRFSTWGTPWEIKSL